MILKIVYWELWDKMRVIKQMSLKLKLTFPVQRNAQIKHWIYFHNFNESSSISTSRSHRHFPFYLQLQWILDKERKNASVFSDVALQASPRCLADTFPALSFNKGQMSARGSSFVLQTISRKGRIGASSFASVTWAQEEDRLYPGIWSSPASLSRRQAQKGARNLQEPCYFPPSYFAGHSFQASSKICCLSFLNCFFTCRFLTINLSAVKAK